MYTDDNYRQTFWQMFLEIGIALSFMWSNYIHHKVWDEITYPFLNFNGAIFEV